MTRRNSILLGLLLLAAKPAAGEEIVAFSSSASGPAAWQADGLTVQLTNRLLRFTLTRDGIGRASVIPHVANVPRALLRLFARGDAVVRVAGGSLATNLVPAGLDAPVDLPLPAGPEGWTLSLTLAGQAGAMLDVRELLVSGALDMDPPLLMASGRRAEQWASLGGTVFQSDGLKVGGAVETRQRFACGSNVVAVVTATSVAGRGVQVAGLGWGAGGELLGEAKLGEIGEAGVHSFAFGRVGWPLGTISASVRLSPVAEGAAAVLTDLWVGRTP